MILSAFFSSLRVNINLPLFKNAKDSKTKEPDSIVNIK